jgi:hypothetical protein
MYNFSALCHFDAAICRIAHNHDFALFFLVLIKSTVHVLGHLSRDFQTQHPLSPLILALILISFRIRGDFFEYVLITRYADNSALCRIAHKHDFAPYRRIPMMHYRYILNSG